MSTTSIWAFRISVVIAILGFFWLIMPKVAESNPELPLRLQHVACKSDSNAENNKALIHFDTRSVYVLCINDNFLHLKHKIHCDFRSSIDPICDDGVMHPFTFTRSQTGRVFQGMLYENSGFPEGVADTAKPDTTAMILLGRASIKKPKLDEQKVKYWAEYELADVDQSMPNGFGLNGPVICKAKAHALNYAACIMTMKNNELNIQLVVQVRRPEGSLVSEQTHRDAIDFWLTFLDSLIIPKS